MATSQIYVSTAVADAGGNPAQVRNLTKVKGAQGSLCLLYAAQAASNVGGQPATTTLTFVVPGSVATDLPFATRFGVAATPAAALVCTIANAGAANATWTITCSTNEALSATFAVYRLC